MAYTNNDELYHYGVLGMKWGIHKARKAGTTYSYKSLAQKRAEKKLNNAKAKGANEKTIDKRSRELETLQIRDSRREQYARQTSTGKAIARSILLGPIGAMGYNSMRAQGYGSVQSALANNYVTSLLTVGVSSLSAPVYERRSAREEAETRRFIRDELKRK